MACVLPPGFIVRGVNTSICIMATNNHDTAADGKPPEQIEAEGTPEDVPTKEPDADLRLTDEGLEMPEFLKGYVGEFTMRTANVTGEFETSDAGLPESDFYDGLIAVYPDNGDYHGDLAAGLMGLSTTEHRETVYRIVDERTDD